MLLLKTGQLVGDKVTKTKGMLTHIMINMDLQASYIYQPHGLNPETKQPVDKIFIEKSRIINGVEEEVDVPVQLLGTIAEDTASGFKGMIVGLVYHLDGCVHAEIKPEGVLESTGATIASCEFDLRRLKGKAINQLKNQEKKEDKKEIPSPMATIKRQR